MLVRSKSDAELVSAITLGVTLHVESVGELKRIDQIGRTAGITPQVALRVNPAFELKSSGMKMAGGAKPFGIDEEQVFDLLADFSAYAVKLRGFHIFCGFAKSQAGSADGSPSADVCVGGKIDPGLSLPARG